MRTTLPLLVFGSVLAFIAQAAAPVAPKAKVPELYAFFAEDLKKVEGQNIFTVGCQGVLTLPDGRSLPMLFWALFFKDHFQLRVDQSIEHVTFDSDLSGELKGIGSSNFIIMFDGADAQARGARVKQYADQNGAKDRSNFASLLNDMFLPCVKAKNFELTSTPPVQTL